MDVETIQLSFSDEMLESGETFLLSVEVTAEQESAMEAFFQINNWQLIKELRTENEETGLVSLSVRVSGEQEAALHAFFQINSWDIDCTKQVETTSVDPAMVTIAHENQQDELQPDENHEQNETSTEQVTEITPEEVSGVPVMNVTAAATQNKTQMITVISENGMSANLPASLLTDLNEVEDGREIPQVIIQEITLPEGMSLDQGLVLANSGVTTVKRITPRGSVRPGDKVHKCNVCGKTFRQLQSFNGHYQSHFGGKPYKCGVCNKGFTLKAALVSHHSIHTGAKPFPCALCDRSFRRKDDMVSHLRTHTGEKPYECDICGKKFKYRNQIPKHRRAHTGERPYQCEHCPKKFTTNIHLTRHVRTHTGDRPYKCEYCTKAFTQYGHLRAHIRIHTDERPYACDVCGRRFREKKVKTRHELLHTTERKFKCDVCGRGFLRQSNLDLHAVMHQKGPKEGGIRRGRPKPKKKQADAEMRAFVANVLSTVKKVDSGMQTDNYISGVPELESGSATNNLSAFVNLAVEQDSKVVKVEDIRDLQNVEAEDEQQFTLVMQDDGGGGYLISNYEGGSSTEEIVNSLPSQQIEVSTGDYSIVTSNETVVDTQDDSARKEQVLNIVEKVIYTENDQVVG